MKHDKQDIENELEKLEAFQLKKLKEGMNNIPDDYFVSLYGDIVHKKEATLLKKALSKKLILVGSLAACFILLFGIFYQSNISNNTISWEQISALEYSAYVNEHIEDFSEEDIVSLADLSDESIFLNQTLEDEMYQFLLDSEIDETELF